MKRNLTNFDNLNIDSCWMKSVMKNFLKTRKRSWTDKGERAWAQKMTKKGAKMMVMSGRSGVQDWLEGPCTGIRHPVSRNS